MQLISKYVTPREIQKSYRKIFDDVRETQEPVIVMKNNKPDVVIISMEIMKGIFATNNETKKNSSSLKKLYGLWRGRKEWKGKKGYEIVRNLRSRRLSRIYAN